LAHVVRFKRVFVSFK